MFQAAAVFEGPSPADGATSHKSRLLSSYGDEAALRGVIDGQLRASDRILTLSGPSEGRSSWLLVRSVPDVEGAQILVVEDSEANREYYTETLTEAGFHCHGAETAAVAIALAHTQSLDLVLVDVRLPDANGFELCRRLSLVSGLEQCPLLLMSADPGLADNTRVKEAGASGFIVNPIGPTDLIERVLDVLEHSRGLGELPNDASPSTSAQTAGLRFLSGRAAVEVGGEWVPLPSGRGADLVATLAAACPAAMSPERLADYVWPSASNVSSSAVYTAVSRLRSFLADIGLPQLVGNDRNGYFLDLEPTKIDLVTFETNARDQLDNGAAINPVGLRTILDAWEKPPFQGTENPLLERWENRLLETRSRLIEGLVLVLIQSKDIDEAAVRCRDLLHTEPWRESIWSLLIIALYRLGRTNDALGTFNEARERLRDELGLDPGPRLKDLEMMILTHDPLLLDEEWLVEVAKH